MSRRSPEFFAFIIICVFFHLFIMFNYKHAITPLEGWPKTSPRNVSFYIGTDVKSLPPDFCKYPTTLLIIVHSTPTSRASRDAIRQTWGNHTILSQRNVSMYFLMGENPQFNVKECIAQENQEHRDIIVEDFIDSYSNLTLKSVTMLKLFGYRSHCQYLLKADEDIFLNVENLLARLLRSKFFRNLLLGRRIAGERRKNNYYQQWYAPKYMYLPHKYPAFLAGPAYVMSLGAARSLYKAALDLPLFHLEDVFLTGICAEKVGIARIHDRHFTDYGIPESHMRIAMISGHSFPPKKLIMFQKMLLLQMKDNKTHKSTLMIKKKILKW